LLGYEIVVALGGQIQSAGDDAEGGNDEYRPRGRDEVEAGIELPAVPEAGVVVEEEGLDKLDCIVESSAILRAKLWV
jgi:hypothetical protein